MKTTITLTEPSRYAPEGQASSTVLKIDAEPDRALIEEALRHYCKSMYQYYYKGKDFTHDEAVASATAKLQARCHKFTLLEKGPFK